MKERALLKTSSKTRQYLRYAKRNNSLGDATPIGGNSTRERRHFTADKKDEPEHALGCSFSQALPPGPYAQSRFPFLSRRTEAKNRADRTIPELAFALPELDDGTPRQTDVVAPPLRCEEEEENEDPPESSAPCFPLIPTSVWSPSRNGRGDGGDGSTDPKL